MVIARGSRRRCPRTLETMPVLFCTAQTTSPALLMDGCAAFAKGMLQGVLERKWTSHLHTPFLV
jgi:hypothetical protein